MHIHILSKWNSLLYLVHKNITEKAKTLNERSQIQKATYCMCLTSTKSNINNCLVIERVWYGYLWLIGFRLCGVTVKGYGCLGVLKIFQNLWWQLCDFVNTGKINSLYPLLWDEKNWKTLNRLWYGLWHFMVCFVEIRSHVA